VSISLPVPQKQRKVQAQPSIEYAFSGALIMYAFVFTAKEGRRRHRLTTLLKTASYPQEDLTNESCGCVDIPWTHRGLCRPKIRSGQNLCLPAFLRTSVSPAHYTPLTRAPSQHRRFCWCCDSMRLSSCRDRSARPECPWQRLHQICRVDSTPHRPATHSHSLRICKLGNSMETHKGGFDPPKKKRCIFRFLCMK
jgi:hypothetical protein